MKHTITFERTITERVTTEIDFPTGIVTESYMNDWADYGVGGRSPFDAAPEQFTQRQRDESRWKVVSATPPLADDPKQRGEQRRRAADERDAQTRKRLTL